MAESSTTMNDDSHLSELRNILDQPEQRILPLLYTSNKNDVEKRANTRAELVSIAQTLFQEIEHLAKEYQTVTNKKDDDEKDNDEHNHTLSGLSELYIPPSDNNNILDAETIWGQVDLQNQALRKLLKKSIKRLAKSPEDIVMLDMSLLVDEGSDESEKDVGDDSDDDDDEKPEMESEEEKEDESDEEDDEDEDEETKRIKARMEQAMDDMDDSEDEENSEEDGNQEKAAKQAQSDVKSEEALIDPVVEELKDGFFDLDEMEDFADEEEDYLPDEAYGQPEKKKKKKGKKEEKSFHQKQRDGDLLRGSDDEDDDEDLDELYEEEDETVRRKKYREDDEIDALYTLYQPEKQDDDDDDDDEDDVVNMTAADLFGKPKKKYFEQYYKNGKKGQKVSKDDDDDSWGEYDFDKEDQGGWRDEEAGMKDDDDKEEDEDDGEESEDDEEEQDDHADDKLKKTPKKKEDNSKHAKQSEKLRRQTEQLEKELLAEKPWQMTGESKSTSRPVNSLLEGTPEFEMASKQAPTITVEHTADLEDVIKKRVLAEDWDDVVPRELPDVGWHKKRGEAPEVSQEKSKLGLGELYEREYLKKAIGYDKDAEEKKSEEDKAKDEMKQLFANLCGKLDALSNYHFAPRPVSDEVDVRPVTAPAIAMEEVLPLHVSDARGVAPEEVYGTKRGREGILRGETEMEQDDRKRLRGSKKTARRKARKEKLADDKLISRLEPGLGLNNPYEKRKMREELDMARSRGKVTMGQEDEKFKYGSSGTFFKRLQDEAQQSIQDKTGGATKIREEKPKAKSSSFKL